ncbi:hypothetical protein, partial [Nitrosomonas sp.]|uniref:hypothetical protein n=1 Tax=Nitrosomonas sp. TaxID=42353 RepID=UPI00273183FA
KKISIVWNERKIHEISERSLKIPYLIFKYPELLSLFSWDPYGRQAIVFLCRGSILLLTHFNSGIDFV